jgi:hypothetical protein
MTIMAFLALEFYHVISHVKTKLISSALKTVCQYHQALMWRVMSWSSLHTLMMETVSKHWTVTSAQDSIPSRGNKLSSSPQTNSRPIYSPIQWVLGSHSPRIGGWAMKMTTLSHLRERLRMHEFIPPLPTWCGFSLSTWTSLNFTF